MQDVFKTVMTGFRIGEFWPDTFSQAALHLA